MQTLSPLLASSFTCPPMNAFNNVTACSRRTYDHTNKTTFSSSFTSPLAEQNLVDANIQRPEWASFSNRLHKRSPVHHSVAKLEQSESTPESLKPSSSGKIEKGKKVQAPIPYSINEAELGRRIKKHNEPFLAALLQGDAKRAGHHFRKQSKYGERMEAYKSDHVSEGAEQQRNLYVDKAENNMYKDAYIKALKHGSSKYVPISKFVEQDEKYYKSIGKAHEWDRIRQKQQQKHDELSKSHEEMFRPASPRPKISESSKEGKNEGQ